MPSRVNPNGFPSLQRIEFACTVVTYWEPILNEFDRLDQFLSLSNPGGSQSNGDGRMLTAVAFSRYKRDILDQLKVHIGFEAVVKCSLRRIVLQPMVWASFGLERPSELEYSLLGGSEVIDVLSLFPFAAA
ncbi:hypothetical protein FRB91_001392 [Serendipita sp. 411]|nr:hypothetical protein FRB91_001392 [Serendipita sp. 411]